MMPIRLSIHNDDHFRAAILAFLGGSTSTLYSPQKASAPINQKQNFLNIVLLDLDFRHSPEHGIEGRFRIESSWQFQSPREETIENSTLTNREEEVLRTLARGLSYKMTADELQISIGTVRTHVKKIYQKLRVHSVTEAIAKAFL